VLDQPLVERARRRPFRLVRHQIAFVPTDCGTPERVGSSVLGETGALPRSSSRELGAALPAETRRALSELGWDAEQTNQSVTERQQVVLSVLPIRSLRAADPTSASGAVVAPLLRRKSSDGTGAGASGKPVLVPALAALLCEVALLAADPAPSVAEAARELIVTVMRDDPLTVARPMLEDLGSIERRANALRLARAIMLVRHQLPPTLSHALFNHLAGGASRYD